MSIVDIPRVTLTPSSLESVYNTLITFNHLNISPITHINNVLVNIKFGTVNSKTINTDVNNVQYNLMVDSLNAWFASSSIPDALGNPNIVKKNFRILVVGADGLVYYDSAASRKVTDASGNAILDASGNVSFVDTDPSGNKLNSMANVKQWDKVNGQFFINENLGCTVYIQGAGTALDGTFYEKETFYQDNAQFIGSNKKIYPNNSVYSGPVSYSQEYYAVRQGLSIERPIGFVVLVREIISKIDTIPEYVSPLI